MPATPGPCQAAEISLFLHWRSLLTAEVLDSRYWMSAFHAMANFQGKLVELSAFRHACANYTSWLHEGPDGGLARQHRMSRSSIGWAPAAVEIAPANVLSSRLV